MKFIIPMELELSLGQSRSLISLGNGKKPIDTHINFLSRAGLIMFDSVETQSQRQNVWKLTNLGKRVVFEIYHSRPKFNNWIPPIYPS